MVHSSVVESVMRIRLIRCLPVALDDRRGADRGPSRENIGVRLWTLSRSVDFEAVRARRTSASTRASKVLRSAASEPRDRSRRAVESRAQRGRMNSKRKALVLAAGCIACAGESIVVRHDEALSAPTAPLHEGSTEEGTIDGMPAQDGPVRNEEGMLSPKELASSETSGSSSESTAMLGDESTGTANGTDEAKCDPNYTPCVPVDTDVDCAGGSGDGPSYVVGPVQVIGEDIYRLDRDNDGIGCEVP